MLRNSEVTTAHETILNDALACDSIGGASGVCIRLKGDGFRCPPLTERGIGDCWPSFEKKVAAIITSSFDTLRFDQGGVIGTRVFHRRLSFQQKEGLGYNRFGVGAVWS